MRIPATKRPWFAANERFGLSFSPCSWQGGVVLGVALAAFVVATAVLREKSWIADVVIFPGLLLVVFLTRYSPAHDTRDEDR